MIPEQFILAWRHHAPWPAYEQIEQDLILSRLIIALYQNPLIRESLAFRGGTALQKLYIQEPARYSEDLDFVQIQAGPIGEILTVVRNIMTPLLGKPQWKQTEGRVTLVYKYTSEIAPSRPMKIKIEVNTREHLAILGIQHKLFQMDNPWFQGEAVISTFCLEELLGTKLRALYQRRKGRDLFDLHKTLTTHAVTPEHIIQCFHGYLQHEGLKITPALYEKNMREKINDPVFRQDIRPLLVHETSYDQDAAFEFLMHQLILKL